MFFLMRLRAVLEGCDGVDRCLLWDRVECPSSSQDSGRKLLQFSAMVWLLLRRVRVAVVSYAPRKEHGCSLWSHEVADAFWYHLWQLSPACAAEALLASAKANLSSHKSVREDPHDLSGCIWLPLMHDQDAPRCSKMLAQASNGEVSSAAVESLALALKRQEDG